jgi:hypothetical protein
MMTSAAAIENFNVNVWPMAFLNIMHEDGVFIKIIIRQSGGFLHNKPGRGVRGQSTMVTLTPDDSKSSFL